MTSAPAWSVDTRVVVTATRTEKLALDAPVRTEVLTQRQIQEQHLHSLQEVLALLPGVLTPDIHGSEGKSVWLQGLDGDRVLVLIDGRPVPSSTGSTADLSTISTVNIERVEVIKGPASALYGSSAMGGVVNVITRQNKKAASVRYRLTLGSWGGDRFAEAAEPIDQQIHQLGLFYQWGQRWSLSSDLEYRDQDGYDLDRRDFSSNGEAGQAYHWVSRLSYQPRQGLRFYLEPQVYQSDWQTRLSSVTPGVLNGEIRRHGNASTEQASVTLGFDNQLDGHRLKGYLMAQQLDDTGEQDVIATALVDQARVAEHRQQKFDLQWDWDANDRHLVTLGVAGSQQTLSQSQRLIDINGARQVNELEQDAEHENIELFVQDDYFLSDAWELVSGLRWQHDSGFGTHLAPSLNVLWRGELANQWQLRARSSLGAGYRVPNLKERYYRFDHSVHGYVVLGNPALRPERSIGAQLGFELSGAQQSYSVSLFHNDIDQLIETQETDDQDQLGLRVFRYGNIASATTRGYELQYAANSADQRFQWRLSYQRLQAFDRLTDKALPDRPDHQAQASVRLQPSERSVINASWRWWRGGYTDQANTQTNQTYATLDVSAGYKIGTRLELKAGVNNLFDQRRTRFDGSDNRSAQGRYSYIGLDYQL